MPNTVEETMDKPRFIVQEHSELDQEAVIVLSTDDPSLAMSEFRKSSSREILDGASNSSLARVDWEKSGQTIKPKYVVDGLFEAEVAGIEFSSLEDRPSPLPAQDDLFTQQAPDSNRVIQLDFEPEWHTVSPDLGGPPLNAYDDDINMASTSEEHTIAYDDYEQAQASHLDMDTLENVINYNPSGRWNIVEIESNHSASVLFATDDPSEAIDALKGYQSSGVSETVLEIHDSHLKSRAFALSESAEDPVFTSPEFNDALAEIERREATIDTSAPLKGLDEPLPNDIEDFSSDLENDAVKRADQSNDNATNSEWKSSKVSNTSKGLDPEEEHIDDQIFVPDGKAPSRAPHVPQQMVNYRHETNLGKIVRATARGIRSLGSLGKSSHNEIGNDINSISKSSVESQFNKADAGSWQSEQVKRELGVVQQDMSHTLGAIDRLKNTAYFQKLSELKEAGLSLTNEAKTELNQLKADPAFNEAVGDVQNFMANVQARAIRLSDNRGMSPEEKELFEKMFSDWSKSTKDNLNRLPDDPTKDDLVERIKKLIEMLIERFSHTKKKEPNQAPSVS